MKTLLLTMTAVGGLAVPAGVLIAQDAGTDPSDSAITLVEADQDRDQVRDRDGSCDGCGDQIRLREQIQADVEADQDRDQVRDRDGSCDGCGDQIRLREQIQARVGDGPDGGPQVREERHDDDAPGPQSGSAVGERDHDRLRTQDHLRDESCDLAVDRDQLRDGSGR